MILTRDQVVRRVAELGGGRAVRWVPSDRAIGDYDGRERTLEVFDVDAGEQRSLLRRIGPARAEIEQSIGGPLIVVFHTPRETTRLYPEMSFQRAYDALATSIGEWMRRPPSVEPALEPDEVPRLTLEVPEAA